MKIAFLEDNIVFAEIIVTALNTVGHEVVHFVSGRSCLKAISSSHFDVCILDWEVPDMSGTDDYIVKPASPVVHSGSLILLA